MKHLEVGESVHTTLCMYKQPCNSWGGVRLLPQLIDCTRQGARNAQQEYHSPTPAGISFTVHNSSMLNSTPLLGIVIGGSSQENHF